MSHLPCQVVSKISTNLWTSDVPAERAEAVLICRRSCRSRETCALWGLQSGAAEGVYGGVDFGRWRDRVAVAQALGVAL